MSLEPFLWLLLSRSWASQWRRHGGDWGGIRPPPPILKSRQKLSMKNGIKLVGYTFRLKNYVKIPPFLSDFSELVPPLGQVAPLSKQNKVMSWYRYPRLLLSAPSWEIGSFLGIVLESKGIREKGVRGQ